MGNKDIKDMFRYASQKIEIDGDRKKKTLEWLVIKAEENKKAGLNRRGQILISQLNYIDRRMWLADLAVSAAVIIIFACLKAYGIDKQGIIFCSVLTTGILGSLSILILSAFFSSGMAEIADSCYFNVRQIAAFEMTLLGIGNLTALLFAVLFVGRHWEISIFHTGLYMGVPFLLSAAGCMFGLLSEKGRLGQYRIVAVCGFMVIVNMVVASVPEIYQASAVTFWVIAFLTGMLLLAVQIKLLFKGIERGDILCMN